MTRTFFLLNLKIKALSSAVSSRFLSVRSLQTKKTPMAKRKGEEFKLEETPAKRARSSRWSVHASCREVKHNPVRKMPNAADIFAAGKPFKENVVLVVDALDKSQQVWKRFIPDDRDTFEREVRVMNLLRNTQVTPCLLDYFRNGNYLYLVMSFEPDFIDLSDAWKVWKGVWTVEQLQTLFNNVLIALRRIHTAGIAHGDVHDHNILVNPKTLQVLVIDFAFSCATADECSDLVELNDVITAQ
jgi:serine/threonine protein kinase